MADSEGRGEWVVGLNPDDRAPNDWLRMVARVFAAYRSKPLKESIVVYIDGLNVTPEHPANVNDSATVYISPGQAFVDDQFIGFIETSEFSWDTEFMVVGVEYCIVLQYQWINQMPPQTPSFNIVKSSTVHSQQQLCLAKAYKDINGDLTIVDDKIPWYREMTLAAAMNTEVDGPELLPYVIAIKGASDISLGDENPGGEFPEDPDDSIGTLDVGWAIDFHHYVGNQINYNSRLHTDRVNDGVLYINGQRLLSEVDPLNPNLPNDPSDPGDSYIGIGNNITLSDTIDDNGILGNVTSDSGVSCLTLKTEHIFDDALGQADEVRAGKICFDHDTTSLNLQNRFDYNSGITGINTLSLTDEVDLVTINGQPIWHEGNLTSTGENIMFIGYHPDGPLTRQDGTDLEDGDTYYNTLMHTFWYFYRDDGVVPPVAEWVEVGRSDAFKHYQEVIPHSGTNFITLEYNPEFVQVSVGGAVLSDVRGDYITDTNGSVIQFTKPLQAGEVVQVFTAFKGNAIGLSLQEINNVDIVNVADNDAIVYDSTVHRWKNQPITVNALDDIGNVNSVGAAVGAQLKFNGSDWIADNAAQMQLGDLGDVNLVGTSPYAGQALVYGGTGQWSNATIIPAGTVISYANNTTPSGFIQCNGASLIVADYGPLFDAIGYQYGGSGTSFRVPDLRGEFIRGIDNGRGIDIGRVFGSHQADAIRNITGTVGQPSNNSYDSIFLQDNPVTTGAFGTITGDYITQGAQHGVATNAGVFTFDASQQVPTADENRPYNSALLTCIKY